MGKKKRKKPTEDVRIEFADVPDMRFGKIKTLDNPLAFKINAFNALRHFGFGFLTAGVATFKTTGNWTTSLISGAIGGVAMAGRKVWSDKRQEQGVDKGDKLIKIIEIIYKVVLMIWEWRKKEAKDDKGTG